MQTWSLTATIFPHSGQRRRCSSRSLRMKSAAKIPIPGRAKPTKNQIQNEPPFSFPIAAVAKPKMMAITTKSTYKTRIAQTIATMASTTQRSHQYLLRDCPPPLAASLTGASWDT